MKFALAVTAVIVACLAAAPTLAERASAYLGAKPTPCGFIRVGNEATDRLRVAGDRMVDSRGARFMPYGVSIVSGPQTINWRTTQRAAAAQIVASSRYWHANSVRLQASESLLFDQPTPGRSYNVPFARAVDQLVCQIIGQRQIPVLNDTTIFTTLERGPGPRTVRFWRFMSRRYKNLPVIFDLFNEPKVTMTPRTRAYLAQSHAWRVWRSGGRVSGMRYVGMQDLVDAIRSQGATNIIWAEEPYYLEANLARLELLPGYRLRGGNIVYAFHKPDMQPASRSFRGVQSATADRIPLVNSEWGQFAATDRPWMCQSDAYRTVPAYLRYLRRSGIGMLAWSLQPGALVKGVRGKDTVHDGLDTRFTTDPLELARPTEMRSSYGCTAAARGQGAGRLVMDYFARYSVPPPAAVFPKLG